MSSDSGACVIFDVMVSRDGSGCAIHDAMVCVSTGGHICAIHDAVVFVYR